MMHAWEAGQCVLCGATESEVNQNIATPDCLGPAGYRLRKEAILEAIKKDSTTTAEPSSVGADAVGVLSFLRFRVPTNGDIYWLSPRGLEKI